MKDFHAHAKAIDNRQPPPSVQNVLSLTHTHNLSHYPTTFLNNYLLFQQTVSNTNNSQLILLHLFTFFLHTHNLINNTHTLTLLPTTDTPLSVTDISHKHLLLLIHTLIHPVWFSLSLSLSLSLYLHQLIPFLWATFFVLYVK